MMNTLAEADAFVKQARANGSITSVQGAAAEYAARKQAAAQARGQWIEQQEAAEAAFVQEMQAEQKRRDAEAQARQQALESYRAGERTGYEPAAQPKSLWQRAGEWVITRAPKVIPAGPSGSGKLSALARDEPPNKRGWPKWVPWVVEGILVLTVPSVYFGVNAYYGFHPVGALLGTGPDRRGIRIVEGHRETIQANQEHITAREVHPTTVAASIAVQSQWNGFPLDYAAAGLDYLLHGRNASPSFGIGQLTQRELDEWGIEGTPLDADASVKGMTERIAEVVNACKGCSDTDKLIIAAMAQNGGFKEENVGEILTKKEYQTEYGIDWARYFRDQKPLSKHPWDLFYNFRAFQQNYNTQYMLRLFTNDLQVLVEKGWEAPAGYDPEYFQCLANGDEECRPTTP